ncbi:type II toxin-antitoxin system PemK/MazF family toxin [Prauserella rugosa]|uniref:mRNA interferase n=1 Tax=Prauserella rugosa TaxID=43354 RepID=A0A660CNK8_9PSEU|nr:type II toxin-antitoxin system PemK/MazF family toxin [Prauserella rugosa]KID30936.1 growth inhibitor [Prauserella sp. Am3]KMS91903.1 mRNA interferase MazF9 [Streptomyces regensis]TWH22715.1 mRNA interferase MazF [Prauserella rugosa]
MRRGDVYLADFEPVRGTEANKRRPVIVVSNDGANDTAARLGRGVLTVVPVTSNTKRVYPFQVLLPAGECGLQTDSKAQAEQVRSIAVERFGARLGRLTPKLLQQVDEALRVHLGL